MGCGRLHWTSRSEGHFEELRGEDVTGLPNGLAWDKEHLYHCDTYHKTVTAYKTDKAGVPLKDQHEGRVVFKTDEKDGQLP